MLEADCLDLHRTIMKPTPTDSPKPIETESNQIISYMSNDVLYSRITILACDRDTT